MKQTEEAQLAAPGAGVPWWQKLAGKYLLLPYYSARFDWDQARDLLRDEGRRLLGVADALDEDILTQRVLVPQQVGLEDSSRFWSYAMVLEHLVILGSMASEIIVQLTHGTPPAGSLGTAELKPAGEMSANHARRNFSEFLERYHRRMTDDCADRASSTTAEHPWFGPLTARQWICFLPFHQRIHIRQARVVLRTLSSRPNRD